MDSKSYYFAFETRRLLLEIRKVFSYQSKPSAIDSKITVAIRAIEKLTLDGTEDS